MANAEHLEKIQAGVERWNEWRRLSGTTPDLIGADLSGRNLARMDFSSALLDGADFRKSDLREAVFRNASAASSDFSGAELSGADLSDSKLQGSLFQGTSLARIKATHVNLTNAVITNSDLSQSNCEAAVLSRAKLSNVSLSGTVLNNVSLVEAVLEECQLHGCRAASGDLTGTRFLSCNLDRAVLSYTTVNRAIFTRCSLRNARFDGGHIEDTEFSDVDATELDLSSAVLVRPSLLSLNLSTATLFDTRIIEPVWPLKAVRATWLGAPLLPHGLFLHPVQDVMGLSPALRRMVADAQLIREYWGNSASSTWRRLALRLWGITCNYGQSIGRWLVFTVCVLFVFTLALTRVPFYVPEYEAASPVPHLETQTNLAEKSTSNQGGQQTPKTSWDGARATNSKRELTQHTEISRPTFFRAFCFSAAMFTTLGFSDLTPANNVGRVMVVILVVVGYAMLGALISILANKLARLS